MKVWASLRLCLISLRCTCVKQRECRSFYMKSICLTSPKTSPSWWRWRCSVQMPTGMQGEAPLSCSGLKSNPQMWPLTLFIVIGMTSWRKSRSCHVWRTPTSLGCWLCASTATHCVWSQSTWRTETSTSFCPAMSQRASWLCSVTQLLSGESVHLLKYCLKGFHAPG